MWSYYGRKTRTASCYPPPLFDTIIEPFAGTAVYSLYGDNWKRNIVLIDKYEIVVKIWHYLQKASENDILSLPHVESGSKVPSSLCDEERWLIGFCINRGSACPKVTAKKFNDWDKNKVWIAGNLYKIKHWQIRVGEYLDAPEMAATWFIDPPYQFGGHWYRHGNKQIDYVSLGEWCKSRKGQLIVCENTKAQWLPFIPLKSLQGQLHQTVEAVYLGS